MKTHKLLFLALIVSAAFAIPAQAGNRHRSNGDEETVRSSSTHYSSPAIHPGVRYTGGRTFAPSPRMSIRSNTFSQRQTFSDRNGPVVTRQFTPRTFSSGNRSGLAHFQNSRPIQTNRIGEMQGQRGNRVGQFGAGRGNRTIGNISPGHNHVFAQHSGDWQRDWDRHHDHFWNGHRCRFVNGSWFIFDIGFLPWWGWPYSDYYAYDYYPYGSPYGYGYGYPYGSGYGYDSGAYGGSYYNGQNSYDPNYNQGGDNSYDQSNNYNQRRYNSYAQGRNGSGSYDRSPAATVADVQALLAREGYYRGKIDGVLGPETRHALLRYQSKKGLGMTGSLTMETQRSLGLGQGTNY